MSLRLSVHDAPLCMGGVDDQKEQEQSTCEVSVEPESCIHGERHNSKVSIENQSNISQIVGASYGPHIPILKSAKTTVSLISFNLTSSLPEG